jgi:hypothetical protein
MIEMAREQTQRRCSHLNVSTTTAGQFELDSARGWVTISTVNPHVGKRDIPNTTGNLGADGQAV